MNRNVIIAVAVVAVVVVAVLFLTRGKVKAPSGVGPTSTAKPASTSAPPPPKGFVNIQSGNATVAAPVSLSVTLAPQGNSGESGTARIIQEGSRTKVVLNLSGAPAGVSQPAHIHSGACPNVGAVKYPLNSVVNGKSETVLSVAYATLLSQVPIAINVHKSPQEASVYVACGNTAYP